MTDMTPEWMPSLVFCHRYKFCVVASHLGYVLGTRSDQFDTNRTQRLLDEGYEVNFVDNHFEDPDPERLEDIVDRTGASRVVLPDVYDEDDLDGVVELGRRLVDDYDTTPIVVPKCEFDPTRVPDEWVLGFSVPSGYGETEVPMSFFEGWDVHLLGGSHRNQIQYANRALEHDAYVVSVDGNAFSKASRFGNIINEPVEMLADDGILDEKAWVKDAAGFTDWGQRIVVSLVRYYELWRQWSLRSSYAEVGVSGNI